MAMPATTHTSFFVLHKDEDLSEAVMEAFRSFVKANDEASFFQSEAMLALAREWPGAEGRLLIAAQKDSDKPVPTVTRQGGDAASGGSGVGIRIVASLLAVSIHEETTAEKRLKLLKPLFRKLSTRTIVYGGPLFAGDLNAARRAECLALLLNALNNKVKGKSIFTQFRNFYDLSDSRTLFEQFGYEYQDHLNLLLDTTELDDAWMAMTANRRREVRLSLKNGARIISEPDAAQMDAFYDILEVLYKKKVKKPLPSRRFFDAVLHVSDINNKAFSKDKPGWTSSVLLIAFREQIIGGVVVVSLAGRSMHEWYACGLDKEFKSRKIYPSVLATWAAIEMAARSDIPVFDFMGMGKPNKPYGVRRFKKQFGGRWVNHGRYFRVNDKLLYGLAEIAYNLYYISLPGKRKRNGSNE